MLAVTHVHAQPLTGPRSPQARGVPVVSLMTVGKDVVIIISSAVHEGKNGQDASWAGHARRQSSPLEGVEDAG